MNRFLFTFLHIFLDEVVWQITTFPSIYKMCPFLSVYIIACTDKNADMDFIILPHVESIIAQKILEAEIE
jgi:uncharacterized membrane protein AbrB (regulator of aidB expression)